MKGHTTPWAQENMYVKEPLVELSNKWRAQLREDVNKQKCSNTKHRYNAVTAGWEGRE
jgi:hypothetical protein